MSKYIDLTGRQFGDWKVVRYAGTTKNGQAKWMCECKCGTKRAVIGSNLRNRSSRNCGCIRAEKLKNKEETHKMSKSRLYNIWKEILQRTTNEKNKNYRYYGGRGIGICNEWRENFETFAKWSNENGYSPNMTIERRDNSKGYQPDNCYWATMKEQSRNKRSNHWLTYRGKTKTITDWAEDIGMKKTTLTNRINRLGWSTEKALETPVKK